MKDLLEGLLKQLISMFLTEAMIVKAKEMLIAELKKLALSTDNELDDQIVSIIEKALK
jgi:hypothetical protein